MLTFAGHLFGCIFWGLLAAVVLCFVIYIIAQGFTGKNVKPLMLVVVLPFLLWQTVLGTGALYARGYAADVEDYLTDLRIEQNDPSMAEVSRAVGREFPSIPDKFIRDMSEASANGVDVAHKAAQSLKDSLTRYVWVRVGWAALFMVLGTALLVKTADGGRGGRSSGAGRYHAPARSHYMEDYD